MAKKYHIGPSGPAPCHAIILSCKYEVNGNDLKELTSAWEKQQEAAYADTMLTGVSRLTDEEEAKSEVPVLSVDEQIAEATKILSDKENYDPYAENVKYKDSDKDIARNLALTNLTELSYTPIEKQDEEWYEERETDHTTDVRRYILEDGSVGYFKSIGANSHKEQSFEDYRITSLEAAINEVNAYRMAQVFGGEYSKMIPETVIREINGSIGTLQREVVANGTKIDYDENSSLKADYRRAAIFDFVIGSLDRNDQNFIHGEISESSNGPSCIRLIDNSFSFPVENKEAWPRKLPNGQLIRSLCAPHNKSLFANNEAHGEGAYSIPDNELSLTKEEIDSLTKARRGVEEWIGSKTIDSEVGEFTIERIDFLLKKEKIVKFTYYNYGDFHLIE